MLASKIALKLLDAATSSLSVLLCSLGASLLALLCDAVSLLILCECGFVGEMAVWAEQGPWQKTAAGLGCVCDSELS